MRLEANNQSLIYIGYWNLKITNLIDKIKVHSTNNNGICVIGHLSIEFSVVDGSTIRVGIIIIIIIIIIIPYVKSPYYLLLLAGIICEVYNPWHTSID